MNILSFFSFLEFIADYTAADEQYCAHVLNSFIAFVRFCLLGDSGMERLGLVARRGGLENGCWSSTKELTYLCVCNWRALAPWISSKCMQWDSNGCCSHVVKKSLSQKKNNVRKSYLCQSDVPRILPIREITHFVAYICILSNSIDKSALPSTRRARRPEASCVWISSVAWGACVRSNVCQYTVPVESGEHSLARNTNTTIS